MASLTGALDTPSCSWKRPDSEDTPNAWKASTTLPKMGYYITRQTDLLAPVQPSYERWIMPHSHTLPKPAPTASSRYTTSSAVSSAPRDAGDRNPAQGRPASALPSQEVA